MIPGPLFLAADALMKAVLVLFFLGLVERLLLAGFMFFR